MTSLQQSSQQQNYLLFVVPCVLRHHTIPDNSVRSIDVCSAIDRYGAHSHSSECGSEVLSVLAGLNIVDLDSRHHVVDRAMLV